MFQSVSERFVILGRCLDFPELHFSSSVKWGKINCERNTKVCSSSDYLIFQVDIKAYFKQELSSV